MIIPFINELRQRGVPVGLQEIIALASALEKGLHESSLDQFYYVAKSLLIHDESRLDDFDQVFAHLYQDIPYRAKGIVDDLLDWLKNPLNRPELSEEEKSQLEVLDIEELKRLYEERLKEQTERHDGGGYWIGTGGRSPFGSNGYHPSGMSIRAGQKSSVSGARSVLQTADARHYRTYRNDLVLDVRQIEVALRKLRSFDRDSQVVELDLEKTIDATAKNFGEIEIKFRKERRSNTRVILLMDVGGSMDPYAVLISQLFSAANRATHWRELRTYYFHNCIYGRVYRTDGLRESVSVRDLMRECGPQYKLIIVGDASMAPYELMGDSGSWDSDTRISALEWFWLLRNHFLSTVWLNPEGTASWQYPESNTVATIAQVFPMFPLTVEGLSEGLQSLRKKR